jgi:hypothetical protein
MSERGFNCDEQKKPSVIQRFGAEPSDALTSDYLSARSAEAVVTFPTS